MTQTLRSAWLETREWSSSYQYHSLWLSCSKISYQLPPVSLPDSHRAGKERTYINLRTRLLFSSLLPQTKRLLLPYFLLFSLSHRLPFPPFPLEVSVIIVQKLHKNSCGLRHILALFKHMTLWWILNLCVHAQMLSCVRLFEPWTVASEAPLSRGFLRQEYWSALPFPSPGDLPNPRIELASPALVGGFFTTLPPGKPLESMT